MLVALLLLQTPAEPEIRLLSHEEMDKALRKCGFEQVSISYVDEFQSDVVEIGDAVATDEQLICAFKTSDYTPYMLIWQDENQARFYEISAELTRPRAKAAARRYFEERGDLDGLPVWLADENEIEFARRLESFCGPDAAGFFTDEFGGVTVARGWLAEGNYEELAQTLTCLMQASVLFDLPVGFIGNEKATE